MFDSIPTEQVTAKRSQPRISGPKPARRLSA